MGALNYHFGTGRGPVHRHVSPADADLPGGAGSGGADAVRLDFDGDGRIDDAMWDRDGDGRADTAVLDLDDDGRAERGFADPSGQGVWDAPAPAPPGAPGGGHGAPLAWIDVRGRPSTTVASHDTDGDGHADAASVEADHDPATAERVCDLDGDGRAEQLLVDRARDGTFESAYLSSAGSTALAGRWDVLLSDTDGDGAVDTTVPEGGAAWVSP